MNQKQVNDLFKESEKKNIKRDELPTEIQSRLSNKSYTGVQESIRENADLLLLQEQQSNKPKILLLLEREPYAIEIIKEFC